MQEHSIGLFKSCLFGENKKKSKAALKAEGNPADEEQPLTGLSQQVYSSIPDTDSAQLELPAHKGADGESKTCNV